MSLVTQDQIKALADEVGDCLIWHGSVSGDGYPTMKFMGSCRLVRRLVIEAKGQELAPRQPVMTTCGEKLCVSPAHLTPTSWAVIGQAAAKRGAFSRPDRRAKIAAARRKAGKLTMEKAREIRLSTDTYEVLSARYGVNRTIISRVKNGRAWVEFNSPLPSLSSAPAQGRAHA
ncbi:hypothetical protein PSQ40_04840 [Curvibacter sp. HBC61]|uniref:HNH nuclease domain-containing protein n=1 Tax=Curvibacter cyanobacteriorum TaxID=3026422 RepID=A0ABT5MYN8_9BURK|nr:hypothetical protein [Curvibacter sp. HBC61]MDD0837892.1 hypothetical protein [Curvibacter sp. HBC61]